MFRALFRSSFVLITRSGTSETQERGGTAGGEKEGKKEIGQNFAHLAVSSLMLVAVVDRIVLSL